MRRPAENGFSDSGQMRGLAAARLRFATATCRGDVRCGSPPTCDLHKVSLLAETMAPRLLHPRGVSRASQNTGGQEPAPLRGREAPWSLRRRRRRGHRDGAPAGGPKARDRVRSPEARRRRREARPGPARGIVSGWRRASIAMRAVKSFQFSMTSASSDETSLIGRVRSAPGSRCESTRTIFARNAPARAVWR